MEAAGLLYLLVNSIHSTMTREILAICLFLTTIPGVAQPLELDIHKNKLTDFLKVEQQLGSTLRENKSKFISQKGVAQPVEFIRVQKGIPNLLVYYFFYQTDSSISYILYEWDENNFNNRAELAKKSPDELSAFIDKYKELYSQASKIYGPGEGKGDLTETSKIETGNFNKEDRWRTADSSEIRLYMVLSNKYESDGAITVPRVYRIRLYVESLASKAKKEEITKPGKAKIEALNLIFKDFLSGLENNNLEQAKLQLAASIRNSTTNQQLETLKQNINFSDSLVIYFTGTQISTDGSSFLVIQYKYASEQANPPKQLIKVIFDDTNQILGVQPVKRL
jgi:hypothetical protein